MRTRYEQLFNIGFTAAYYVDDMQHDDFVITPTQYCKKQMSRYRILSRKTFDGISLFYECSPATADVTPFKPIRTEEKFAFLVSVVNPDFWYFGEVNNWETDKIYFLKNPAYNTTGNISVLNGPLNAPVLFRPMDFMYDVPLENVQRLLQVLDANGSLVKTINVRALVASDPVGKTESTFIDLRGYTDGLYTIRHITGMGNVDEQVYCSANYAPGTLAVIEITYKGDVTWTGIAPFQKYIINISSRLTDWFFDVHIRPAPMAPLLASTLFIKHEPVGPEPVKTFSVVGVADDANGFVQFKSDTQLNYSQQPVHLKLLKPNVPDPPHPIDVMDPMPLPSAITLQKDILNNLITKIIVNV